jgi:hypothetical protein
MLGERVATSFCWKELRGLRFLTSWGRRATPAPPPTISAELGEPMKLLARGATPTEQLKNAAIEAALRALGDGQSTPKDKPALTGVRAVAAGAALYTAGWAAFKGRGFLREQFSASQVKDDETTQAGEGGPSGDAKQQLDVDEESAEAGGRQDDDAGESSSEAPTPRTKRKPVRRAARTNDPQPSLNLPQQRWPRMSAGTAGRQISPVRRSPS